MLNGWIAPCVGFIELLFLAPHRECLGLQEADIVIIPRLEVNSAEQENAAKPANVREGILHLIHGAQPLVQRFPSMRLEPDGALVPFC